MSSSTAAPWLVARQRERPERYCEGIPDSYYHASPIAGSLTLQNILVIAAAPLLAITVFVTLYLSASHLRNYTNPPLQRQLLRVIFVLFFFAVFGFFSVWFYDAAEYLMPVADAYEGVGLVAFFLYMVNVAVPDASQRDRFFHELERVGRRKTVIPGGSAKWMSTRWNMVFQVIPVRIIVTIATWIVNAVLCPTNRAFSVSSTLLTIANSVATVVCVVGLLQTHSALSKHIAGQGIMTKFISFKLVVALGVIQGIVFTSLNSNDVLKATDTISHMDWTHGIPEFITVVEMFVFVVVFIFTYTAGPFKRQSGSQAVEKPLSFGAAVLDALNPVDIISGLWYPWRLRSAARRMDQSRNVYDSVPPSYGQTQQQYYPRGRQEQDETQLEERQGLTTEPQQSGPQEWEQRQQHQQQGPQAHQQHRDEERYDLPGMPSNANGLGYYGRAYH